MYKEKASKMDDASLERQIGYVLQRSNPGTISIFFVLTLLYAGFYLLTKEQKYLALFVMFLILTIGLFGQYYTAVMLAEFLKRRSIVIPKPQPDKNQLKILTVSLIVGFVVGLLLSITYP